MNALPQVAARPCAQATLAAGLVDAGLRRVDGAAGRTARPHGGIRKLRIPPVALMFWVRDPARTDRVKAGDAVEFAVGAAGSGDGVTELAPAP